jgi:MULE transposase domain
MAALNDWARDNGLGFRHCQGTNKSKKTGQYTRWTVYCDRGRNRPSIAQVRKQSTTQTGCPWAGVARAPAKEGGLWGLIVTNDTHNHLASRTAASHTVHQVLTPDMLATVNSQLLTPTIRTNDIFTTLQKQFPDRQHTFSKRLIQNLRQKLQQEKLGGYTPTQALIKDLVEKHVYHDVLWDDGKGTGCHQQDDTETISRAKRRRPEAIFWSYPWCETMYKRFPWVLQMDNTYNTNRKRMYLFQITVVTNLGSIANVGFGLLRSEKEEGFYWVVEALDRFRTYLQLPSPTVIITDKEMALKNALSAVFPSTQQQLCIFHLNKNMALNIKRKCKDATSAEEINAEDEAVEPPLRSLDDLEAESDKEEEDEDEDIGVRDLNRPAIEGATDYTLPGLLDDTPFGIYTLWRVMVYTAKEEDFDNAWERMQTEFNRPSLVSYVKKHLIPFKEQWACCYINRYMNFGQRTTSPTEASHRNLKSYLLKGTSTLFRLAEVIQTMLMNAQTAFEKEVDRQETHLRRIYMGQTWLGHSNRDISYRGVNILAKQKYLTMRYLSSRSVVLSPCTGRFRRQYSMPCSHDLFRILSEGGTVKKADWHRFWWLDRSLDDEDPFLDIEEPLEVTGSRGRPRGSGPFVEQRRPTQPSARRLPSAFEAEDADDVTRPPSTAPAVLAGVKRPRQQVAVGTWKRPRTGTGWETHIEETQSEETQRQETQSQIVVAIPSSSSGEASNSP